MGLLSGLEKFGLKLDKVGELYEEDKKDSRAKKETEKKPVEAPKESDYLLLKSCRCPVCDKNFKTKAVKNGKVRRIGADNDLRPKHENIDTLKYGVTSCPYCGYSAMNDNFEHISPGQIKLVREGVCSQIKMDSSVVLPVEDMESYDYDTAIERYKLALFNTMVKKGKSSEKAYACLRTSWLYRGKAEEVRQQKPENAREILAECKKEEDEFYVQAFEGFNKAMASESFPICGMNETTLDFLMAAMALRLGKYDLASRFVSSVIGSSMANSKTKDKAREMKDEIAEAMRKSKEEA